MIDVDTGVQSADLIIGQPVDGDWPARAWYAQCPKGHHDIYGTRVLENGTAKCMVCERLAADMAEQAAIEKRRQENIRAGHGTLMAADPDAFK